MKKYFSAIFCIFMSLPFLVNADTEVHVSKVACERTSSICDDGSSSLVCDARIAVPGSGNAGQKIFLTASAGLFNGGQTAGLTGCSAATSCSESSGCSQPSLGLYDSFPGQSFIGGSIGSIEVTLPSAPGVYKQGFAAEFRPLGWDPRCGAYPCYTFPSFSYNEASSATINVQSAPPALILNGSAAFLKLLSTPVFAQENKQKTSLIADVEIPSASVTSQSGRTVNASFTLRADVAQTGIRYALEINKKQGNTFLPVDTQVAQEVIILGQNESKQVNANFTAPQTLTGTYDVFITAYTTKGVVLATQRAGEVIFTQEIPNIIIDTCDKSESLEGKLICTVKNSTKITQTGKIYVLIRNEGLFGNDVGSSVEQSVILKPNESKIFSFTTLSKDVPHASIINLTSNDGKILYDTKSVVVVGVRKPRFDNVFMVATDKDVTVSGIERRHVTKSSRTMNVIFTDEQGNVCGTQSANITEVRTDITATPTCTKGSITATLVEASQVLDTQVIPFELAPRVESKTTEIPWWVWMIAAGILVLGIVRLNINKKAEM